MGMSSTPAAPPLPDPKATAEAQAVMNKQTAVAQTGLNAMNQYTPDGSLEYSQSGHWEDGTPRFSATTNLSPAAQGIFDTNKVTEQNIATIGKDQSGRIGDLLGTPLKLGNEATEARLMELGMKRLDPRFAKDEEALRQRLVNSGVREGSAAYDSAYANMKNSQNDAVNSLLLSGRGQANQEIMSERNQPINEITALMSGSQVSNPTFQNTPQSNIAGVDYMGAVQNNYNAQVQQQKMKADQNAALMGGLFSMAGTVATGGMKYSDRRLKEDIDKVGKLDNGLPLYSYRYKGADGPKEIGVMAQDVEKKNPHAVVADAMGRKMVNYDMAVA